MKELNFEKELKRLSKSEYIIHNEGEKDIFECVVRKIVNVILILMIVLLCVGIASWIGMKCCRFSGFNSEVNSENIGDYLALFGTHCSVVFLTTSLMTMLSEKSKFVYHVDLVELVLINPLYYNFKTLVVYAMSSILWAMFGFLVKDGSKIIGGFIFGIVAIIVLFWRMILIYYRRENHKNKIRRFMRDIVEFAKQIEEKKVFNKYWKELENIGYIELFQEIIDQALKELENNNMPPVIEALQLLEESMMWHVGEAYDNDEKKIEETYNIIVSNIGLSRSYQAKTKIYLEDMYINFASEVAMKRPDAMERYYYYSKSIIPSSYLIMVRSIVFPHILNCYLANDKKQEFFKCLLKWERKNFFWKGIKKYIEFIALDGKHQYLAEYYDEVRYSVATGIEFEMDLRENDYGISCFIPSKSFAGGIYRRHEQVLEKIYNESVETFENILSYKKNRKYFMQIFSRTDEGEVYWDHWDKCIYLSESILSKGEPKEFLIIFNEWSKTLLFNGYENREKDFEDIVGKIIDVNGGSVVKTNTDVEYLLEHIYRSICSDEGDQIYISFFGKTELELRRHTVKMLELYEKALEEGVDLLENRSYYCDKKDDPQNTVDRIKILKKMLRKVKRKRSFIRGTKINKSE